MLWIAKKNVTEERIVTSGISLTIFAISKKTLMEQDKNLE
jgi:hypothetical protein